MLAQLSYWGLTGVAFLIVITVIITVHEFGHFLTARAFGVAVDRFSIGFGPTMFARRDRWGVEWRVAWLPLGGYVRFAGDDNVASVPDQDDLTALKTHIVAQEGAGAERRYFFFKPLWQRALIVAAGPAINFALSIVLFAALFGFMGEPGGAMKVLAVTPHSGAAAAGVRPGDVITGADGQAFASFNDFIDYIHERPGVTMQLIVQRAGHTLTLAATPGVSSEDNPAGGTVKIGLLGVSNQVVAYRHFGPLEALSRGAEETWTIVGKTGYYVGQMIQGKTGWPFAGFLGTIHVAGAATQDAVTIAQTEHVNLALAMLVNYIQLAAFLSTSIGLVNLLPIPVLDGGHLMFYAFEAVARRPLPVSAQMAGYRVGLALLVGLMLFTAWHDLQRMQVFHFLGAMFS